MIQIRSAIALLLVFAGLSASAQTQKKKPVPASATINVVLTNTKDVPLKGQQVLFINTAKKQTLSGRTDAKGTFSLLLPTGATYSIKLKTLTDTIDYKTIEIPKLEEGQYFESPMTVSLQFEPARTFTLNHVFFDTGKPTLRPDSFKELNEIAEYMKWKEDEHYEISGHTDNVGKDEDNQKLSQARAESVRNYLVKKGIDASRLIAKGYGATRPVADNNSNEGRQKNRRTEVAIL